MEESKVTATNLNTEELPKFEIVGFWKRLFAFILDSIIVSIPFVIVGYLFTNFVVQLGPWGHTTTFIALIVYFTVFDSKLGKGQSIGSRITKIRVINKDGRYLSPQNALFRSLLFVPIVMFNRWTLPIQGSVPIFVSSSIFIGGGLALAYAFIFNKQTKQCIHDMITNAYVVSGEYRENILEITKSSHKYITYGFLVIGVVISFLSVFVIKPNNIMNSSYLREFNSLRESILQKLDVQNVGIYLINTTQTISGNSETSSELSISLVVNKSCKEDQEYCDSLIRETVSIVLREYQGLDEVGYVKLNINYGFDLGIAKGSYTFSERNTVEDWRSELGIVKPDQNTLW